MWEIEKVTAVSGLRRDTVKLFRERRCRAGGNKTLQSKALHGDPKGEINLSLPEIICRYHNRQHWQLLLPPATGHLFVARMRHGWWEVV